jgi:hypothetical protein
MRYLIGFFITIGLIILLIIMLVSGGGKPKVPATNKTLTSYANSDAAASLVIDGPVNANSEHQAVRITVDRDNVTYEILRGYDGNVAEIKRFSNTENSYDVFLHALAHAGFTRGNTDPKLTDEKGYCPLGTRFVFEFNQGSDNIERFWTTDCGPKTYQGNANLTIQLFKNQVPGYDNLSNNLNL